MSRVGQFLGKFFAGATGKNETPLRAYGKLPMYAEYRRLEVAPGTPTLFSQWMDAGRLAWVRAVSDQPAGEVRASRLMLQLPGAKELVIASIWDSRDSLGRVFPFSFFVVCPTEALGDDTAQRWVAASVIHDAFDRFHAQIRALGSGGDFYRLFRNQVVLLKPDDLVERTRTLHAGAASLSARDWFAGAGFDDGVDAGRWFAAMARRFDRWRTQPDATATLSLSCPLARGVPYRAQALIWLEMLGRVAPKAGRAPWIMAPGDDGRARAELHIALRDPMADDFRLLTTDAEGYHYVEHLARVPQAADGAAETPSMPVPDASMMVWLAKFAAPHAPAS